LLLQRLGRRDIGGDHIILDQPVRIQPLAHRHARTMRPCLVQHHAPFGQVEFQRIARLFARLGQSSAPPAGPQPAVAPGHSRSAKASASSRARRLPAVDRAPAPPHRDVRRHADDRAGEAPGLHPPMKRRSSCGRPSPRDPRPRAASRCRTTAPRAASARRRSGK
jgi:hypothetical protein